MNLSRKHSLRDTVLWVIAGVLILLVTPDDSFGWLLLTIIVFVAFDMVSVVVHELGHALSALALGMRVFRISIGMSGKTAYECRLFDCTIEIRSMPLGGAVHLSHTGTRWMRSKGFLTSLAGPLANGLLALGGLCILQRTEGHNLFTWLMGVFVATNVWTVIVSLWPGKVWIGTGMVPTDGLALLSVPFASELQLKQWHASYFALEGLECRRRRDYVAAKNWFEKGIDQYPDDPTNLSCLGSILLDMNQYEQARSIFQRSLKAPNIKSEFETILLNNIAWADLMTSKSELLDEADRYSREAFDRMPWLAPIKGTRGSTLVEIGEVDTGIALLKQAITENAEQANRAFNACYLSLAMVKKSDLAEGQRFLELAKALDLSCPLIGRVRCAIGEGNQLAARRPVSSGG